MASDFRSRLVRTEIPRVWFVSLANVFREPGCVCSVLVILTFRRISMYYRTIKIEIHSSCEIEDFVETHLCKLCVILRSRVLRVVCPHLRI